MYHPFGYNTTQIAKLSPAFFISLCIILGSIWLFKYLDGEYARATTIALTVLAVYQWLNAWNVRSESSSVLSRGLASNKYLIIATFFVIILQLFAIYNPIMQKILATASLSFYDLFLAFSISLSLVLVEEFRKLLYRRHADRKLA